MGQSVQKHIVVSAVNIRKGGTLTVLRDCLSFLSAKNSYSVTAIVHNRSLCEFPGINYIEIPWSVKGWGRRLWCEYVTMNGISKKMEEPDLWLSLHDTTPRVRAKRQAVYCHTSFPFLKRRWRDFLMDVKIPLFSMFTGYAYSLFSKRNDYLIVQQEWFRQRLSSLIHFPEKRIIVAPPSFEEVVSAYEHGISPEVKKHGETLFFYPSSADCHKNFEIVCRAASILESLVGVGVFRVVLTLSGEENRYSRWLKKRWGNTGSIDFHGYMSKAELGLYYDQSDCLVFASRIETWGLPISEFKPTGKPMLLADLPYSHEASSGAGCVSFFGIDDCKQLVDRMLDVIRKNFSKFAPNVRFCPREPYCASWEALFERLLENENSSVR